MRLGWVDVLGPAVRVLCRRSFAGADRQAPIAAGASGCLSFNGLQQAFVSLDLSRCIFSTVFRALPGHRSVVHGVGKIALWSGDYG